MQNKCLLHVLIAIQFRWKLFGMALLCHLLLLSFIWWIVSDFTGQMRMCWFIKIDRFELIEFSVGCHLTDEYGMLTKLKPFLFVTKMKFLISLKNSVLCARVRDLWNYVIFWCYYHLNRCHFNLMLLFSQCVRCVLCVPVRFGLCNMVIQ